MTTITATLIPFLISIDAAATLARIGLGIMFILHGWPKIKDVKATTGWVKKTGWAGGAIFAILFTLLEFFGGIALIVGFLTQFVGVLIALEMVATSIFSKKQLGKKLIGGYELDVAYLVLAVVVALLGPGPWSVDALLG